MLGANPFKRTTIDDHPWYKSVRWMQCICFSSILQYTLFSSSSIIAFINGFLTQPQVYRTFSPGCFSVLNLSGFSFKAKDKFEMFPLHHKQVNNKDPREMHICSFQVLKTSFICLPQARHGWHKRV